MRTGIFVGSFNPFTIGHDSIVTRALPLFDRLVIGVVGDQVHKPDMPSAEERIKAISDLALLWFGCRLCARRKRPFHRERRTLCQGLRVRA